MGARAVFKGPLALLECPWAKYWTHSKLGMLLSRGALPVELHKVTPAPIMTTLHFQYTFLLKVWCCPRCWNAFICLYKHVITTWLCHRCAPGKISACVPGCYTQLPHRRRNRQFPWRRCSTGCCGTDVPGIRTPTPVSGGSWEQSCQPCPHFRVCLSVAITQAFWYSVIHQKGFIWSPRVPLG